VPREALLSLATFSEVFVSVWDGDSGSGQHTVGLLGCSRAGALDGLGDVVGGVPEAMISD
jgi:hypothetical protein